MLQECDYSQFTHPETAQTVALLETYFDPQHARDAIASLNAQLEANARSAAEQYSSLTRDLEYMERVMYHWLTLWSGRNVVI